MIINLVIEGISLLLIYYEKDKGDIRNKFFVVIK